jgi:hypothetical protein
MNLALAVACPSRFVFACLPQLACCKQAGVPAFLQGARLRRDCARF